MLRQLFRRFRNERGQSQTAMLGTIVVAGLVALIATSSFSTVSPATAKLPDASVAAKVLLHNAQVSAGSIAYSNGGSYAKVGLVNLRKHGLIPFAPSLTSAFLSSASSTRDSYTLTVTAEPGGARFTISRDDHGRLTHS